MKKEEVEQKKEKLDWMFKISWFIAFGGIMSGLIAVKEPQTALLVFMSHFVGGLAVLVLTMPTKKSMDEPETTANPIAHGNTAPSPS